MGRHETTPKNQYHKHTQTDQSRRCFHAQALCYVHYLSYCFSAVLDLTSIESVRNHESNEFKDHGGNGYSAFVLHRLH